MSSVIGSLLDGVRLVSDAGLRFLAYQPIRIPKLTAARLEQEIEQRWAEVEREVANIVRARNSDGGAAPQAGGTSAANPQAGSAGARVTQGGWGPMP